MTTYQIVYDALPVYKVLALFFLCAGSIFYLNFIIDNYYYPKSAREDSTRAPSWQISSWQPDSSGNWLQQPILSIDGAKYVFDTPQEYIAVFQDLARRSGDPTGTIKHQIEALHQAARYRVTVRTAAGLPPDAPMPRKPGAPVEPSPIPPLEEILEAARYEPAQISPSSTEPNTQTSPTIVAPLTVVPPPPPSPAPPPTVQTLPALQSLPPQEGIVLKLKRSQKESTWGGIIYMLDARVDASAEVQAIIHKHRLGGRVIYESSNRKKRNEAIRAHLEQTHDNTRFFDPASVRLKSVGNVLWHLGGAAVTAAIATLSLRITVDSLLSGVHVECKSMEELLEAERAIKQAKGTLEGYIDTLTTFDGREQFV